MKKILIFWILTSLLVLASCSSEAGTPDPSDSTNAITAEQTLPESDTQTEAESEPIPMKTFQNPLSDVSAPDPCVVYHDGYYYAVYLFQRRNQAF